MIKLNKNKEVAMKTAVIYARYSCDKQTEQSIEGQIHSCETYARSNDILIIDHYIDRATSGTNDRRPEFQRMLKDSDKRKWDYVLVYKLDRFSRNKYEMATHKKHLKDNNIKLLSASENIPDTPEGIILESMLEGMAEYYSAELSQKILRGQNESRRKGQYIMGRPPYGYRKVDKKLQIIEEQARVIRYIYDRASSGIIIKNIIEELHEQGVTFNGKLIAKNTVYNILRNECYIGLYHFKGETFDNIYPRIIDDDTYNAVQSRLTSYPKKGRNSEVEYILKGRIFCGYCGKPIIADTGTTRKGELARYYKCSKRKRGGKCEKDTLRKDHLEEFILKIIKRTFGSAENINKLADMVIEAHKDNTENHATLSNLIKQKTVTENSIGNLITCMEQGIISPSTKQRLAELEEIRLNLEQEVLKEEARLAKELKKDDVIAYIRKALRKGNREIICLLIDKIVLYNDKIDIHFKFKKNINSDDKSQSFLFYKALQKIEYYDLESYKITKKDMEVSILYP